MNGSGILYNSYMSINSDITLDSLGASVPAPQETRVQRQGAPSTTEERALSLLGSGISAEQTASALGVSASRISQLLAESEFSGKVEALRYEGLQKHNDRDGAYDSLEDSLLAKLESALPMMIRPSDILRALTAVNGAKRRGQTNPDQVSTQTKIVNLLLPTKITQKFTTNTLNQVIAAGEQDLVTIQAATLLNNSRLAESDRNEAGGTSNVQVQDESKLLGAL